MMWKEVENEKSVLVEEFVPDCKQLTRGREPGIKTIVLIYNWIDK